MLGQIRSHADDLCGSSEDARWVQIHFGSVHGNIAGHLDLTRRQTSIRQSGLETERTSDEKGYRGLGPFVPDVVFAEQKLSILVDVVLGDVGTDIEHISWCLRF